MTDGRVRVSGATLGMSRASIGRCHSGTQAFTAMSTLILIASAMVATQVVALSLLVGDAIRRERNGGGIRALRRSATSAAYTGVERRRVARPGGVAFARHGA